MLTSVPTPKEKSRTPDGAFADVLDVFEDDFGVGFADGGLAIGHED